MKKIKALYGQTLVDIAVQELGDPQRSFELSELNGISITKDLDTNEVIMVPAYDKDKRNLVQLFSDIANAPASGDDVNTGELLNEGIDYWAIENDFVVI